MSPSRFEAKLQKVQVSRASDLALMLAPHLSQMPLPMQRLDDPFLPFGKAIVNATRDLVCGYIFDLAAYLALGAAGAVALERTIAYAGTDDLTVTVLHGPFVGAGYSAAAGDAAFNVHAVTLIDARDAAAYRAKGLGVLVTGSKIGDALTPLDSSLHLHILGEDVLYAGHGEDFAQQVRAAIQGAGT